jgi:hypothetical protein
MDNRKQKAVIDKMIANVDEAAIVPALSEHI